MATLLQFEQHVAEFVRCAGVAQDSLLHQFTLGLFVETGKFADCFNRYMYHNETLDRSMVVDKARDVLLYTAALAEVLEYTLDGHLWEYTPAASMSYNLMRISYYVGKICDIATGATSVNYIVKRNVSPYLVSIVTCMLSLLTLCDIMKEEVFAGIKTH